MAQAPTGDKTLTPDDGIGVLEELLPAQNKSYNFGLKLKLPPHEVKAIHAKTQSAEDHLRDVIEAFLRGVGSETTWRVIIHALRSPTVYLPQLASEVEAAHFPNSTAIRKVVPETGPSVPFTARPTDVSKNKVKSNPTSQLCSITEVKNSVEVFRCRFNAIKIATINCLVKCQVAVTMVVFLLTSIKSVDDHKLFLQDNHKQFQACNNHWELFGLLNFYWSHFAYDLLDQLITELIIQFKDSSFESVASEMAKYKKDLQEFRKHTTLELFCLAVPSKLDEDPPPGFRKMVVEHDWPNSVMLEDVERFRRSCKKVCNLNQCAMMVNSIRTGPFTVTWFISNTVINRLIQKRFLNYIIKHFNVTKLVINERHIYQTPAVPQQGPPAVTGSLPEMNRYKDQDIDSTSIRTMKLTVQCHCKKKAPCGMTRGSATTDHKFAYFTLGVSNSVFSYEWSTEKWNKLPSCPYDNSALVVIDGTLTTVGGGYRSSYTNKLFTLRQRQWVEEYPPMNTARSHPAVVSTSGGDYIIVIGGYGDDAWTDTVGLFKVKTRRWYKLTNIPQPLAFPSATLCGNQLHVIGYHGNDGYTSSLQNPPSNDKPITLQSIPHIISWTSLPGLPVTQSTAATLNGQLVIIGGEQYEWSAVNSIHQLVDRQWVVIGSMSSNRWRCLVVNSSPDRMMIVGGGWGALDSVEECVVLSS